MPKSTLRIVLTILMYSGVVVFLAPYFTGHLQRGIPYLIGGAITTVICGLLRSFFTEGECSDRTFFRPNP